MSTILCMFTKKYISLYFIFTIYLLTDCVFSTILYYINLYFFIKFHERTRGNHKRI